MGGFRSFFIESKLFQLVVEEGGNFFSLKIFERGKYYMQSVFMGKSAALWIMRSLEHNVIGASPKQFFTLREGDTAYTLQRGSNSFGQYLAVTELKVGGLRRTIIIPAGKSQQGWRTFGIELRRILEPSHYAMGGLKFVPYSSKQIPKSHPAKPYVEVVKAPVQARLKHVQQPLVNEQIKAGSAKNIVEVPSDSETQAGSSSQPAVGGGEGGINGKNKNKEKISEGNNVIIPLKPNLNSKMAEIGKLRDSRKARWIGRGLTVSVSEYGKRRVSWGGVKSGKQAGRWVIVNKVHDNEVGLGPSKLNAHVLMDNKEPSLGLGLSSPRSFEAGESSFSELKDLESSYLTGFMQSSGRTELTATKEPESSTVTPIASEQPATSPKGSFSLTVTAVADKGGQLSSAQPPTVPKGPAVVAQAYQEQVSSIGASCESGLVPEVSPATTSEPVRTLIDPRVSELESMPSTVASEEGDEDIVGFEGPVTSEFKGAQLPGPTLRELVKDLDKSWGNSKDWILQLRDGRQLVLPLSLYRSPDCMSVCSSLEGECVPGDASSLKEGQWVTDEGEELVEYLSVVPGSESEMWDFDERLRSCAGGEEPLVVVPLATEGPVESVPSHVKEIRCTESVDNCPLSQWVTNRIKAFKKSVGTSLEGFEEQITGLLLAIEARKKEKQKIAVGDQTKLVKSGQKGQRELKNLLSSLNVEYDPNKSRSASSERAVVPYQ